MKIAVIYFYCPDPAESTKWVVLCHVVPFKMLKHRFVLYTLLVHVSRCWKRLKELAAAIVDYDRRNRENKYGE